MFHFIHFTYLMSISEVYISLGDNCAVAYHLSQLGLRQTAFPFDWMLSPKLCEIVNLIDNNFDDLFNVEHLEFKNYSDNFPYIEGDNWVEEKSTTRRVRNKKYKVDFVHDFHNTDACNIEEVCQKYTRRIERFYNLMRNSHIVKKIYRISPSREGEELLYKCFSRNGFVNYQINFKTYSDLGKSIDWRFDNFNWRELFCK